MAGGIIFGCTQTGKKGVVIPSAPSRREEYAALQPQAKAIPRFARNDNPELRRLEKPLGALRLPLGEGWAVGLLG